jgi:hypothetical protein
LNCGTDHTNLFDMFQISLRVLSPPVFEVPGWPK